MSLPTVEEVRTRIEQIDLNSIRLCLKFAYLAAARVSEVVGHASPTDNTPYGPQGTDAKFIEDEGAVIFDLSTAKREGVKRIIALPIQDCYEPWTKDLYSYFEKRAERIVFPFTRQRVWKYAKDAFKGLSYPIESYTLKDGQLSRRVKRHMKPFAVHALRHMRITDLIQYYGLDMYEVCGYAGWVMPVGQLSTYAHLNWKKYFPKLLKKRY